MCFGCEGFRGVAVGRLRCLSVVVGTSEVVVLRKGRVAERAEKGRGQ